jgi:stress response protein SCP2
LQRQARRQAAEEAFGALVALERHLTTLHLESFPTTVAPPDLGPEPVDRAAVLAGLESRELAGLGMFDFGGRREAKRRARAGLDSAVAAEQAARAHRYQDQRAVELEAWHALAGNDPGAVLDALEVAFADNESDAVAVNCEQTDAGALVSLIVLVQAVDALPERKPVRSAAGAPTTPKRTKKELHDLYAWWLASTVLATVKEAFAVAPRIAGAQVLVVRRDTAASDPANYLTAVYTGRFDRARLARWDWTRVDPVEELLRAPSAHLQRKGASREVVALDLRDEPDIAALLTVIRDAYSQGQSLSNLAGTPPQPPSGTPPPDGGVVLVRGANTPLPTALIQIVVAWDGGAADDLDISALLCGADGRVIDPEAMVFYNQPVGAGGAVRAAGRSHQPTTAAMTDRITIDLPRIPAAVQRVAIAASLDGSDAPTLAAVTGLRVAVTTVDETIAVFPLTGLTSEAAAVTVEIYQRNGTWRLRAVGQGWTTGLAGLARDYGIDVTS